MMVFEHIEKLKTQYTDKYVVVDDRYPELQRFRGQVGAVKTVNMSGRALVQFDMDNNIGWYDIDLAFLKLVDAPAPKEETTARKKAPADKPGFKSTPAKGSPAPEALEKPIGEVASSSASAKPKAESGKPAGTAAMSTDAILAAARGKAAAPAAKPAAPASPAAAETGKKMSVEEILAAARRDKTTGSAPAATAAPATPAAPAAASAKPAADAKKMSVADILAAARGEKSSGAAAAPAAPPAAPPTAAPPEPEPVAQAPAPAAPAPAAAPEPAATSAAPKRVQLNTVEEMLDYCRRVDVKK